MGLESLGGNMPAGQPVAVSSGNRTHVFAIAAGGGMNHWSSTNGGPWDGPVLLPGGDLAPSFPCAIALPDGSVNVFAIGFGGAFSHGGPLTRWSSTDGMTWALEIHPAIPIPGRGNGLAAASMDGKQIDVFAITAGGIIWQYSFNQGRPPIMVPLPPHSPGLSTCVLAAVSAEPGKFDLFAVEPTVGMPLHWHFDGGWTKQPVGGPFLHINKNNGFAAVSPAPGRAEVFAITGDGRMSNWSKTGTTFLFKQQLAMGSGSWPLPDGVPAVVAGPAGKLDLFAIGTPPNPFTGGRLVHWRFNGTWSEPSTYDANLAAGGVTAVRGAGRLDVFGFNSGTNNSLQHWPGGIGGSSREPWVNWAGNRRTDDPVGHCYPTCLEEVAAIVRTAAQKGRRVRAVGSSWSMSDVAVTPGYVVETSGLSRVIETVVPAALLGSVPSAIPLVGVVAPKNLIHVEAGIQLEKLMELLDKDEQAPFTMGGASGQTVAGVISTSVHGSDVRLPPFPDAVRAIHLVGPDGRQHWIEPDSGKVTEKTKLEKVLGPDVEIHYNDDWFDSVLVSVGSLGIIYSVILEVTDQYHLEEKCEKLAWNDVPGVPGLRSQLSDGSVFTDARRYVRVVIDTTMPEADATCYLTTRVKQTKAQAVALGTPFGGGLDIMGAFCECNLIEILYTVGVPLGATFGAAVLTAVSTMAATTPVLLPLVSVLTPLIVTTAAAIPVLIAALKLAPPGAVGDLAGAILNELPALTPGVVRLMGSSALKVGTPNPDGSAGGQPIKRDIAHRVMTPRNKGECVARGQGLEIAFDTADQSYLRFLDAAFAMLKDQVAMGNVLAGWFSFRFVGRSRAVLSPQRSGMTCMVEAVGIRALKTTRPLLASLESLGRSFGGVQHWGMFDDCRYEDVARSYPRLDTWLRVRQQLTNDGVVRTFDNDFMDRCGLIPTAKPKMLLRHPSDGAISVIYGGAKLHVPDPATLNRLFAGVPVRDAQVGELEHVGNVPGDGTLFHEETTGKVFAIVGGAPFHVPDWDTLTRLYPGFLLRPIWENALAHLPEVALKTTDISFLAPLLLSEPPLPALKTADISFLTPLLLSGPVPN